MWPFIIAHTSYDLIGTAGPVGGIVGWAVILLGIVLGLLSIVCGWTFFVPIIGLILGFVGLKREPSGKRIAITGLILNGLMIVGWVLLLLFLLSIGIFTGSLWK